MKPFTRVKIIKGHEYIYEITPYYDSVSKIIKQKSKYLGKSVNGKPVRKTPNLPRNTYHYGEFIPLLDTVEKLKIEETLNLNLPTDKSRILLALSFNRVVRPMPFHLAQSWYETTRFKNDWNLTMTSQRISELLAEIGESSVPNLFSSRLVQQATVGKTLIYDITSLSSYSKMINLLEYGYNREHSGTEQVNLSLVVDKEKGIPLLYDVYPGSIVDVSTLLNTVKKIRALNIQNYTLVLDRGFFSTSNVDELFKSSLNFIVPATYQLKDVKQLMSTLHKNIADPDNLHVFGKETLFVKSVMLPVGEHNLRGYGYYSPSKEHNDR